MAVYSNFLWKKQKQLFHLNPKDAQNLTILFNVFAPFLCPETMGNFLLSAHLRFPSIINPTVLGNWFINYIQNSNFYVNTIKHIQEQIIFNHKTLNMNSDLPHKNKKK